MTGEEGIVVRNVYRPGPEVRDGLGRFGVATIHEAQGKKGLLEPALRPIYPGTHISGTAVTVSVPPGDNWMIHIAVEVCGEGDVMVVAPSSPSDAGYFGELLATALMVREVRGLVIDAGCRDVAALREMGFPVWSKYVSAQGTVKESLGSVNLPIVCAGQRVEPGDVVVADDDGVVIVASDQAERVLEASQQRESGEEATRKRYQEGELSLDVHSMREELEEKGLRYVDREGAADR
ncbi:MAG: 4-carboxy-4-hydroxy-2-oxoadipate aldolase/oxaloacetate decarboxylase [Acidimicrobiia bacterium]